MEYKRKEFENLMMCMVLFNCGCIGFMLNITEMEE